MGGVKFPDFLIFYMTIDFLTGVWLVTYLRGKVAHLAATMFLPMIAVNATIYAAARIEPSWHYHLLFALAWGQLLLTGAADDGLRKTLDIAIGGIRNSVSSAAHIFRIKK